LAAQAAVGCGIRLQPSRSIQDPESLWRTLDQLGDAQSRYILEQIVSGDVFHVESIMNESEVKFSVVLQGGTRPQGTPGVRDVIAMHMVEHDSRDARELTAINRALAPSLGMVRGVTHAEFLRSHADGDYYFLGIGAGVGGQFGECPFGDSSFIDQLMETSTGVSLWREWRSSKLRIFAA
jgi:hypothetical protein